MLCYVLSEVMDHNIDYCYYRIAFAPLGQLYLWIECLTGTKEVSAMLQNAHRQKLNKIHVLFTYSPSKFASVQVTAHAATAQFHPGEIHRHPR